MGIAVTIAVFICMEGVTWLTHKYVMHGFLWRLHEDHHRPTRKVLQRNDLFFVVFAIPSIAMFAVAAFSGSYRFLNFPAAGIFLYGLAYFIIHDVFIHRRLKLFRNTRSRYLYALRRAHKQHHKHTGREDGECFGMLWVPLSFFRKKTPHG
jgi:beta-carotene 3-hydroxylase